MKYPIFSVRDTKVGFNQPMTDLNEQVAKRNFSYAINNNDIMSFQPKDYDLFKIGEFDTELGTIEALGVPVLVCDGNSVIGVEIK